MRVLTVVGYPFLIALLFAAHVEAQSLFIDGAVSADIERRASFETDGETAAIGSPNIGGTVPGVALAIGTMVNPSFSVRFEMHWQGELSGSVSDQTSAYATQSESSTEELTTGSVLVGYHTPRRGAVQLAYLGGVTFAVLEQEYTTTFEYNLPILLASPIPPGTVLPPAFDSRTYESTSYGVTAQVGLDVDVKLTPRFSVVPQVRAFAASNMLSVRPGIAARLKW